MKCSSLVCLALIFAPQLCPGDDNLTNSQFRGFQVPAAARNAPEAPAWNPQAQPAAPTQQPAAAPATAAPAAVIAPPTNNPTADTNVAPAASTNPIWAVPAQPAVVGPPPATVAPAAVVGANPAFAAPAPQANTVIPAAAPPTRPLVSVMKRKTRSSAAATAPAATPQLAAPTTAPTFTPPPSPTPAASPAPAALTDAQTDGAIPINSVTSAANEYSKPDAQPIASPSGIQPARFDEPVSASAATSTTSETPTAATPLKIATTQPQLIPPPDNAAPAQPLVSDPQVTPANSNPQNQESTIDPEQLAAAHAAADLLAQSFASTGDLPGQSESLSEIISASDEHQRLAVVNAYWRLSHAISDYIWTSDELERLNKAIPSRVMINNPMISTALATATARIHEAELSVTKAQQSLSALSASPGAPSAAGILTSDRPLVGPYRTYFDAIFANRSAPARLREINATLPIRVKIIDDHAAAVRSAMDAVHYAEEAHSRNETDIRTVLACHEDLHRQRRDFLQAVSDYNLDIAEYAAGVAAPGTPQEKFVGMLIRPKPTDRLSAVPERSTFNPAENLFSFGSTASNALPPPPSTNARDAKTAPVRSRAADGWVPSTLRPIEEAPPATPQPPAAEEPSRAAPQSIVNPVNPPGKQADPFAPSVGDRYGNRYNEGR
jgi:hypothetical protein